MGLLMKKTLLACLLLGVLCYGGDPAAAAPAAAPVEQAQTFSLSALNGQPVQVDWGSKLTVLTFGALWCPTCRNELPELDAFAAANASRLIFYMVDIREPAEKVSRYLEEKQYSLPTLLDETGEVSRQYAIETIPTTVIIDSHGRIVYRKKGAVTQAELEKTVADQL